MKKNPTNNQTILSHCIKSFAETVAAGLEPNELFEIFVLAQLTKRSEIDVEDIEDSIVDGWNDGGIDALLICHNSAPLRSIDDLEDHEFTKTSQLDIHIVQSKCESTFKEAAIDKLLASQPDIFNLSVEEKQLSTRFNDELVEKVMILRGAILQAAMKGSRIVVNYCYATQSDGQAISSAFQTKCDQLRRETQKSVNGAEVTVQALGAKDLIHLYQLSPPTQITLTFKETPLPVRYEADSIGYIGVVKLNDYFEFIKTDEGEIRESIFESNVRHWQGNVDVNKTIKSTLQDDYSRDFWWLNNGVTVIASHAGHVGNKLSLQDVQIVNGLQTSFSLFSAYEPSPSETRSILVKVIVSQDKETIDKVIRATNSQTNVTPYSLRATDRIQRELELFFEREGFYYDRRKNYYKNKGKPLARIFGIQTVAQAVNAIVFNLPSLSRGKPTSLIKEDKNYNRIFDERLQYAVHLNCARVVRIVTEAAHQMTDREDKSVARNFTYHVARVLASMKIGKVNFGASAVASMELTDLAEEVPKALGHLKGWIANYMDENPELNIVNVAKSARFDEFVTAKLPAIVE